MGRRGFLAAALGLPALILGPMRAFADVCTGRKRGFLAPLGPDSAGSAPTAADFADFLEGTMLRHDYLLLRRAGLPADYVLDHMRPTMVARLGDRAPAVERALRDLA